MFFSLAFQNTYTNARKLLEAARHLAQSGDCNPDEIQKRVDHFEKRVQEFIDRVDKRKGVLQLAVNFYSRTQQVWYSPLCSARACAGQAHRHTLVGCQLLNRPRAPGGFFCLELVNRSLIENSARVAQQPGDRRDVNGREMLPFALIKPLSVCNACIVKASRGICRPVAALPCRARFPRDTLRRLLAELRHYSAVQTSFRAPKRSVVLAVRPSAFLAASFTLRWCF